MMTVPLDLEFYFKKALPVIHNYCTQNPLVIDRQKVATLGMLLEKPRISHIQLAWLQAVTEFDFQTFDSINPLNPTLFLRIHELQENFRRILANIAAENTEKDDIKKEVHPGELDPDKNAVYQLSLNIALRLLGTVLQQEQRDAQIAKVYSEINTRDKKNNSASAEKKNQKLKPSYQCNDSTKNFYEAIELILKESPDHELTPIVIWRTLLTKEHDKKYKIKSVQSFKTRSKSITFKSEYTINYHAGQALIKNVIEWFLSR